MGHIDKQAVNLAILEGRTKLYARVCKIMEKLLRVREAAQILNVCQRTIWRLLDDGELTRIRVGKSVRVERAQLEQFIARQRTASADAA